MGHKLVRAFITTSLKANVYKGNRECEIFFPQIKPEKKVIEMTDEEKAVFAILKSNSPIALNDLKVQSGLSNKKWDKTIKGLTKKDIAKVSKVDDSLIVNLL